MTAQMALRKGGCGLGEKQAQILMTNYVLFGGMKCGKYVDLCGTEKQMILSSMS